MAAIVAATILAGVAVGSAATVAWNGGGGNDNWSAGLNWVGGVAPTNPAGTDDLIFAGGVRATPSVDAPWSGVQSIGFTGATAESGGSHGFGAEKKSCVTRGITVNDGAQA
jgi:hypothetical protein